MTQLEPEGMEQPGIDPVEHAKLARENALLRAGVDLESKQGQILANAWSNRDPDVEAIRSEWELLKPQPAPEPEPALPVSPQLSEAEQNQAQERQELAAGGHLQPDAGDVDPMEMSIIEARKVLEPDPNSRQRAGTHIDAMATALHHRAVAAGKGDSRVYVQE